MSAALAESMRQPEPFYQRIGVLDESRDHPHDECPHASAHP